MKGILMKDWAVRALLDNRKTVTRRVVKDAPNEEGLKPCKTMCGNRNKYGKPDLYGQNKEVKEAEHGETGIGQA